MKTYTPTRTRDVWITTEDHTGVLRYQEDGSFKYDSLPLITTGVSDVWKIYEDEHGRVWASGTEALICYDPSIERNYSQPFHTIIHQVTLSGADSALFKGFYSNEIGDLVLAQPESYVHTLPFKFNDITFSFAAPFFESMESIEYSYMLEGRDKHWSMWQKENRKEYTNLPSCEYTFKVKSKNAFGIEGIIAEYRFNVLPPWYLTYWAYALYVGLALLIIWLTVKVATYRLEQSKVQLEQVVADRTSEIRENMSLLEKQKAEIEWERKKSDDLLLNILPKETATELKEFGSANTHHFESVSVLFTDFKNFTQISENLTPEELVNEINVCFSAFDEIIEKHGLEKIKTIGDSYMCAGGLPVRNETHAINAISAAFELQEFINNRGSENLDKTEARFEMRCGIHTGPVVAGVVGVRKFQYDIWGDTVNLASRMETSGEVGKVNISETTYELVKNQVECTFRGEVEAKHKGKINMYFADTFVK